MFWRHKPQVLVAGAGPVGLFSALSLAHRGVAVRIIDEEWRCTTHSYALALHPKSLELLDELGLAREVIERARELRAIGFYDRSGRKAGMSLDRLQRKYPLVAVLAQADLEELLIAALERNNVEVEWDHRLARITPHDDHVQVTVDSLGTDSVGYDIAHRESVVESSHEVEVPFVIGADGHSSLVRTQLGIKFDSVRPPNDYAIFEFEADGDLPDEMCVVLDDETTNVLWPMTANRLRWSFQVDTAAGPESRDKDRLLMPIDGYNPDEHPERLVGLIRTRAPWFEAEIRKIAWATEVRFEYRLASAFGEPRVHLVGDASHLTGPVGVQSMNGGLGEAAELGEIIAGVLNGKKRLRAVTDHFARRLGEWRRLLGIGTPGLVATESAPSWARERAPRITSCIPASGDDFGHLVSQLGLEPDGV